MSNVFARYKLFVCLVLAMNVVAGESVRAAQRDDAQHGAAPAALAAMADVAPPQNEAVASAFPAGVDTSAGLLPRAAAAGSKRPAGLVPLYISLGSLQAFDVHSTSKALKRGGVEGNPVMRGLIGSPASVLALKAGFMGLIVTSTEKLWKKHRTAAILTMVGMNGLYAAVVAHNYSIAR